MVEIQMNDVKESVFEMEETSNVRYDYIYFFPPIITVISFKKNLLMHEVLNLNFFPLLALFFSI